MSYSGIEEAFEDITPEQIGVTFRKDGSHEVRLKGLCSDGITAVLDFLTYEQELTETDLIKVCPQLANLDKMELLRSALSCDGLDWEEVMGKAVISVALQDKLAVGSTFSQTREITSMDGDSVTYKDQRGRSHSVLRSSFQTWAKDKWISK